jgi:hypothetical protein
MEFGQLYCMDLLKMILNKFILYFSEFNSISYKFWNLKGIFGILKNLKKLKNGEQCWATLSAPRPSGSAWPSSQ